MKLLLCFLWKETGYYWVHNLNCKNAKTWKVCRERILFNNLWMMALKKMEPWNQRRHFIPFFSSNPSQMFSKVAVPKMLENSLEKPMVILVSVAADRPSHLQTMNFTACFPGNFGAAISPNIFSWLFHLSCITSYYFLNSYQIINQMRFKSQVVWFTCFLCFFGEVSFS